jgi:hypothetical protein
MGFGNIDTTNLSVEQRIVLHLAKTGYLTSTGDITRALAEQSYAEYLVTGNGLSDEGFGDAICDHVALTNDEIQEVFDNDI